MNNILTKSYTAGAAVAAYRFCKAGSTDYKAIQATDGSAPILGASLSLAAALDQTFDMMRHGIALVELGGTVTRGNLLTADANGKAVAVSIVAGTSVHVGGVAEVSGVAGDVIPALLTPGMCVANDTGITTVDVTISSAQMLALNATPRQLVAAPGAGKAILLVDAQLFLDYGSSAYAGIAAGEDLQIRYTDGSGAIVATVEATGFLDATADSYRHVLPLADAAKTPAANAALMLHMSTGEITTGDSPLKLRVRYRTVDLAF